MDAIDHAIPLIWKQINVSEINLETNYVVQDHHHLIKKY